MNSDGVDTTFSVTLYSQNGGSDNYIIDQSGSESSGSFGYNNNPTAFPSLILSASFNSRNLKAKTFFDLGFQVSSRGLYATELIVLDLSPLVPDNMGNLDYECLVLSPNMEKSPDFEKISITSLSEVIISAKSEISSFSQSYFLRCYHIVLPSSTDSNGGFNISGFVSDSTKRPITSKTSISVTPFNFTSYFSYFELEFLEKTLSSPGNGQELRISIISTNQNLNSSSRVILWFPYYYPPLLNSDGKLFCQINEIVRNSLSLFLIMSALIWFVGCQL